jgi:TFIIF-interacting CTD phosphatase-like protein
MVVAVILVADKDAALMIPDADKFLVYSSPTYIESADPVVADKTDVDMDPA